MYKGYVLSLYWSLHYARKAPLPNHLHPELSFSECLDGQGKEKRTFRKKTKHEWKRGPTQCCLTDPRGLCPLLSQVSKKMFHIANRSTALLVHIPLKDVEGRIKYLCLAWRQQLWRLNPSNGQTCKRELGVPLAWALHHSLSKNAP